MLMNNYYKMFNLYKKNFAFIKNIYIIIIFNITNKKILLLNIYI